jgi:hypothetical protein
MLAVHNKSTFVSTYFRMRQVSKLKATDNHQWLLKEPIGMVSIII